MELKTSDRYKDLYGKSLRKNKYKKRLRVLLFELIKYKEVFFQLEYLNLCLQTYPLGTIENRVAGLKLSLDKLPKRKKTLILFKREYILHLLFQLRKFRITGNKQINNKFYFMLIEAVSIIGELRDEDGEFALVKSLLRDYPTQEYGNLSLRNEIYMRRLKRYVEVFTNYFPTQLREVSIVLEEYNIEAKKLFYMLGVLFKWFLLAPTLEGRVVAGFQGGIESGRILLNSLLNGKYQDFYKIVTSLYGVEEISNFANSQEEKYENFLFRIFQYPVHFFPDGRFYFIADIKLFFEAGLQNIYQKLSPLIKSSSNISDNKYLTKYGLAIEDYTLCLLEKYFLLERTDKEEGQQDGILFDHKNKLIICVECTVSGVDEMDFYALSDNAIRDKLMQLLFITSKDKDSQTAKLIKLNNYYKSLRETYPNYRIIPLLLTEDYNGSWELLSKSNLPSFNVKVLSANLQFIKEELPQFITLDDIEFFCDNFTSEEKQNNTEKLAQTLDSWRTYSINNFPGPFIYYLDEIKGIVPKQ
jgi:hypothetical protein